MAKWYRIFGTSDAQPDHAALMDALRARGWEVMGRFGGDDEGWFRAGLEREGASAEVECYLVSEEGIRQELNTWAAWLEASGDGAERTRLMQHVIDTRRLFTATGDERLCETVCQVLAQAANGIYQVDGAGFFDAEGRLLVAEEGR